MSILNILYLSYLSTLHPFFSDFKIVFGSGALFGKILFVRIIENNIMNAYFRAGYVVLNLALPRRVRAPYSG